MNPKETPELTVQALMALRQDKDALRVITERLRVKEMGPADHIRTKHEVKEFVAAGDEASAHVLIERAGERREVGQKIAIKNSLSRGNRISQ